MCGIWVSLGLADPKSILDGLDALKVRGPEGTQFTDFSGATLGFTRLAINGLTDAGMQPMRVGAQAWVCNGEIYNWRALASNYGLESKSGSDCDIIGPLYNRFMEQGIPLTGFFRALDGVFAIAIVDEARDRLIVARDPYGVRPLYFSTNDSIQFASELKALPPGDKSPFFPGFYMTFKLSTGFLEDTRQYHMQPIYKQPYVEGSVRKALESAVKKRMMTERPVAALLSGGLDSSLVAALVAANLKEAGAPPLRTFSIGMSGSADLAHARLVADWIGSDHTELVMSPDEFFAAIPEVIKAIETYDTTTVRASVGNWLLGKAIAATDCKVVFNGDGADEVWGSYLYFYGAPSDAAYEEEVLRLLQDIHYFDVLRSDRCISCHGLEPRTPYLDKEFVATALGAPTALRRPSPDRAEKLLMRQAFEGLLPKEVLYRRKEAFSDGVSGEKSWFEIIQERTAIFGYTEKEYYKMLYRGFYGDDCVNVPYMWMPKWCDATDPSARTLKIY